MTKNELQNHKAINNKYKPILPLIYFLMNPGGSTPIGGNCIDCWYLLLQKKNRVFTKRQILEKPKGIVNTCQLEKEQSKSNLALTTYSQDNPIFIKIFNCAVNFYGSYFILGMSAMPLIEKDGLHKPENRLDNSLNRFLCDF